VIVLTIGDKVFLRKPLLLRLCSSFSSLVVIVCLVCLLRMH